MSLKVIGAGLARTGTSSLKIALERLLGGPCYHMSELLKRPVDVKFWRKAANKEVLDWDEHFSGYVAAVDIPASLFWVELMKFYPTALVVLSLRDSRSWLESCRETVWKVMKGEEPGQSLGVQNDPVDDALRCVISSSITPVLWRKCPLNAWSFGNCAMVGGRFVLPLRYRYQMSRFRT
jgi:hypothetical protein